MASNISQLVFLSLAHGSLRFYVGLFGHTSLRGRVRLWNISYCLGLLVDSINDNVITAMDFRCYIYGVPFTWWPFCILLFTASHGVPAMNHVRDNLYLLICESLSPCLAIQQFLFTESVAYLYAYKVHSYLNPLIIAWVSHTNLSELHLYTKHHFHKKISLLHYFKPSFETHTSY